MSDSRLRAAERAAKVTDGRADRGAYLAQLARAAVACSTCGDPATCLWHDEPNCVPCVLSGMRHGHQHVHDEPDDCVTEVEWLMPPNPTAPTAIVVCPTCSVPGGGGE